MTKSVCSLIILIFIFSCDLYSSTQKKLDELLSLSLQQLTYIQITSVTKIPQKIEEVPAIVRIITSEEIKNNHYFTLEEALSDLPGIQFRNILGLNSYIFMRGLPSQNNLILVLIDGIQINELNSGGFYGGGQYNLSNVERIEVVYGPASALYGTNAISGIINIITKDPQKNRGLDIYGQYGSFNTANAGINYGYWNDKNNFGIRLSGMYKTTEKADLKGEAGDYNWSNDLENFEDDYAFDVKGMWHQLTFGLNYQNKQTSSATSKKSMDTIYRDSSTLWNIRFINAYLKHKTNLNKNTQIFTQIYYRNATVLDNSVQIVTDTAQIGYYRPNDLYGLETMLSFNPTKKFNWTGGVVYEKEWLAQGYANTYSHSYNSKPPKPEKPAMEYNSLFSFYGQCRYLPFEILELYAGARFDNSSIYEQVTTPRLGVIYHKNQWTAKLLYTDAFRAPKSWDYTDGVGNSNLEPEEMSSVEFYTAYYFPPNLKINISVFRNLLRQLLIKEQLSTDTWCWINHGKLNTTGFEMAAVYETSSIHSYINYAYNQTMDENDLMIPEISKHQVNMGFLYRLSNKLHINIKTNYYGKRKNTKIITTTGNEYVDPIFIFHSTFIYHMTEKIDFQISVKNLFNSQYYHTSNLPPDRYRQPQRTFLFQTHYQLK